MIYIFRQWGHTWEAILCRHSPIFSDGSEQSEQPILPAAEHNRHRRHAGPVSWRSRRWPVCRRRSADRGGRGRGRLQQRGRGPGHGQVASLQRGIWRTTMSCQVGSELWIMNTCLKLFEHEIMLILPGLHPCPHSMMRESTCGRDTCQRVTCPPPHVTRATPSTTGPWTSSSCRQLGATTPLQLDTQLQLSTTGSCLIIPATGIHQYHRYGDNQGRLGRVLGNIFII